ncbi:hypothetical protein U2J09_22900 [Serratia liquefaciens]|uniref:hypothetical protein n=1 Tax=Serratia liquefaciens TaxID=614 RepID=UPI0032DF0D59
MNNGNIESGKSITTYLLVFGLVLIAGGAFYFYVADFFIVKLFESGIATKGSQLQETISLLKWYPAMFTLSIGVAFVFVSFCLDVFDVVVDLIKTGWERLLVLVAKRGNKNA